MSCLYSGGWPRKFLSSSSTCSKLSLQQIEAEAAMIATRCILLRCERIFRASVCVWVFVSISPLCIRTSRLLSEPRRVQAVHGLAGTVKGMMWMDRMITKQTRAVVQICACIYWTAMTLNRKWKDVKVQCRHVHATLPQRCLALKPSATWKYHLKFVWTCLEFQMVTVKCTGAIQILPVELAIARKQTEVMFCGCVISSAALKDKTNHKRYLQMLLDPGLACVHGSRHMHKRRRTGKHADNRFERTGNS